jgi:hypothetical protein
LGNCITNSSLNPKTKQFYFGNSPILEDQSWKVEDFTKQHLENGNNIANIDQQELIKRLQVFDSSSSLEEIKKLLEENQGDFVSVMNILKEKNLKKNRTKNLQKKKILRGNLLREKILKRLREKRMKGKKAEVKHEKNQLNIENESESVEKRVSKPQVNDEINKNVMVDRIMMCKSKEDVQNVVMEIAEGFNNIVKKLKHSKSESFILRMGIKQRRDITREEIKKRVEVEKKLEDTKLQLDHLIQSQNYLQQSLNGGWMQNHFGREGY